jgi:hypothetical protein
MRLDLRLRGMTSGGRPCLMELTVYASSQKKFMKEVKERAKEGPWYYDGTAEPVPETEKISIEHAERLGEKKRQEKGKGK